MRGAKMTKESRVSEMPFPHVLRAKQAAAYLGIHEKTVWQWAREGRLPQPIRQGRRCSVWKVEDLDAYLARCANGGEA